MNNQASDNIFYRPAILADVKMLSVLYKQVYMQTYATEGISEELVDFMNPMFAEEKLENSILAHPETGSWQFTKVTWWVLRRSPGIKNAP